MKYIETNSCGHIWQDPERCRHSYHNIIGTFDVVAGETGRVRQLSSLSREKKKKRKSDIYYNITITIYNNNNNAYYAPIDAGGCIPGKSRDTSNVSMNIIYILIYTYIRFSRVCEIRHRGKL